jgi:hypothetical protein
MSIRDNIAAIIGDHFPDEGDRQGITNHIMYFVSKNNKVAFACGLVVGIFSMAILLKWLA